LILFGYTHGLFGLTLWRDLVQNCCETTSLAFDLHGGRPNCSFVSNTDPKCRQAVTQVSQIAWNNDIDVYNLYADCDTPSSGLTMERSTPSRRHYDMKLMMRQFGQNASLTDTVLSAIRDDPPCIDDSYVAKWLNQEEVRQALHIAPQAATWDMCSGPVEQGYTNIYKTLRPQVRELLSAGIRGLIYNGDVDMACNFLGDEWFADSVGQKLIADYQKWHSNGQVAGFVKHYEKLIYMTVKGSGHMVPQDKPGPALQMFINFIE